MGAQFVKCNKCRMTIADARSWKRCKNGHVICEGCTKLFFLQGYHCPLCKADLITEEEYARSIPTLEGMVMKAGWKLQIRWWKYLFRSPDLVLVVLCWGFSLMFLLSAGRNPSFFANVLEWVEGSFLVALAPVLTLMFIRQKKTGLGMIPGWQAAWRGDKRPVWVIVGIASVVFLIHLIMETKPIG